MTAPVFLPEGRSPYTSGFFAYDIGNQRVAWHDGTVAGYKAMDVLAYPSGVAVIVLANADTAPSPILASQIRALLLPLDAVPGAESLNAQPTWWSRLIAVVLVLCVFAASALVARYVKQRR